MHIDVHENGGAGTVVLLHGQVLGPELWAPFLPVLPARVIVPHLPGHGASGALRSTSFAMLHDQLEAALLARRPGPVTLVGFSVASLHATALALRSRLEVISIVMLAPALGLDVEHRALFSGFADALAAGKLDLVDAFVARGLSPDWASAHPAAVASLRQSLRSASVLTLIDELRQTLVMPDLRARLAELRVPVTVRVGGADVSTPVDWARGYVAALPRGTLEVVPGAGHLLTIEDYEGTAECITRHLGGA